MEWNSIIEHDFAYLLRNIEQSDVIGQFTYF